MLRIINYKLAFSINHSCIKFTLGEYTLKMAQSKPPIPKWKDALMQLAAGFYYCI
jgi:hypothetical protein